MLQFWSGLFLEAILDRDQYFFLDTWTVENQNYWISDSLAFVYFDCSLTLSAILTYATPTIHFWTLWYKNTSSRIANRYIGIFGASWTEKTISLSTSAASALAVLARTTKLFRCSQRAQAAKSVPWARQKHLLHPGRCSLEDDSFKCHLCGLSAEHHQHQAAPARRGTQCEPFL